MNTQPTQDTRLDSLGSSRHGYALCARLALWVLLTILFTSAVVSYSYQYGRLTSPPGYDDVVYMTDGLRRLRIMEHEGLRPLVVDYVGKNTHSPYSSFLAFAAFWILGPHDWAPYVANGLVALALLLTVDFYLRGRPWWERFSVGLFVLSVPLSGYVVHEFRPDVAHGLVLAFGIVLLLDGVWIERTRYRQVAAGLPIAAALLTKPSVFPLTLALAFLAIGIAILGQRFRSGSAFSWRKVGGAVAVVLAGALLPALPHYLINGKQTVAYIYNGLYGEARVIGDYGLGLTQTVNFYLWGAGGREILGRHLALWLVLLLAAGLYAWRTGQRKVIQAAAVFSIPVAAAYLLATLNHIKSQFLALTFHALLLFGVVLAIRWAFAELESRRIALVKRIAFAALVVAAGFKCAQMPPRWGNRNAPALVARREAAQYMSECMREKSPASNSIIFFTVTGNINSDLIRYLDLRADYPLRTAIGTPLVEDLARYTSAMDRATWVVASEEGNCEVNNRLPSGRVQTQTLALIRTRQDFRLAGEVPTATGKRFFVFRRISPMQ